MVILADRELAVGRSKQGITFSELVTGLNRNENPELFTNDGGKFI